MPSTDEPLDPEAARVLSKVRRLMGISVVFTGVAIAAVLMVVGYRMMRTEGPRAPSVDAAAMLPAGARIVATTVGEGRLVLTVEAGGETELHLFDLQTLQPRGKLAIKRGP
ncbi:MAG: hypothetical protein IT538_04215 [Variibacter sp.]|nr:hypothetical protein [Variibacter sp.]